MTKTPKVWVIGKGQLGEMLTHAGVPLGINVKAIDITDDSAQKLTVLENDIVTAEREEWPSNKLSLSLSQHTNFINGDVFSLLADRKTQKELLDRLSIPTSPWCPVKKSTTSSQLHQLLGDRILLKRRTGGYDGKGQYWLENDRKLPNDWLEKSIAEKTIYFDEEISLVGARDHNKHCHFYPLALNRHQNGILMASIAPLKRLDPLQTLAESYLSKIMDRLNYVGVMAMECFRIGNTLIINELAPRVHNSGHWTQMGCYINQFELHLRALCHLPIPPLNIIQPTIMINLIGIELNNEWLSLADTQLFWYNKSVRKGRKLGHLTVPIASMSTARFEQLLPSQYQETLNWIDKNT